MRRFDGQIHQVAAGGPVWQRLDPARPDVPRRREKQGPQVRSAEIEPHRGRASVHQPRPVGPVSPPAQRSLHFAEHLDDVDAGVVVAFQHLSQKVGEREEEDSVGRRPRDGVHHLPERGRIDAHGTTLSRMHAVQIQGFRLNRADRGALDPPLRLPRDVSDPRRRAPQDLVVAHELEDIDHRRKILEPLPEHLAHGPVEIVLPKRQGVEHDTGVRNDRPHGRRGTGR